jgi:hypothetical protein
MNKLHPNIILVGSIVLGVLLIGIGLKVADNSSQKIRTNESTVNNSIVSTTVSSSKLQSASISSSSVPKIDPTVIQSKIDLIYPTLLSGIEDSIPQEDLEMPTKGTYISATKVAFFEEDVTKLTTTVPNETRASISRFVELCSQAFKIPEVDSCLYVVSLTSTNDYGKKTNGPALTYNTTREKFAKYDWSGLKGKTILVKLRLDKIFTIDPVWDKKLTKDSYIYYPWEQVKCVMGGTSASECVKI